LLFSPLYLLSSLSLFFFYRFIHSSFLEKEWMSWRNSMPSLVHSNIREEGRKVVRGVDLMSVCHRLLLE